MQRGLLLRTKKGGLVFPWCKQSESPFSMGMGRKSSKIQCFQTKRATLARNRSDTRKLSPSVCSQVRRVFYGNIGTHDDNNCDFCVVTNTIDLRSFHNTNTLYSVLYVGLEKLTHTNSVRIAIFRALSRHGVSRTHPCFQGQLEELLWQQLSND